MRILLFVLPVLIILSCDPEQSVDVNQDRIKTNYSINYDDNTQETRATASFWFGSTPLKIQSPAQILANDRTMKKQDILGIVSYIKTFDSKTSVLFEYTDHDARIFENELVFPAFIGVPASVSSMSTSKDFILEWEGDPIGENESVTLEIKSKNEEGGYWSTSKNAEGGTSIMIEANSLGTDFEGVAKLTLTRLVSEEVTDAPRGGEVSMSYSSKSITIEIKP